MNRDPVADAALKFMLSFADEAQGIIRSAGEKFSVEKKSDASEVTEIDHAIERLFRTAVEKEFPGHGVIGEEFGIQRLDAEYTWVIDPIDGTQNFARGIPTYGIIIGLHRGGQQICGLIDHPALARRYHAVAGRGAFLNGAPLTVKQLSPLVRPEDALVAISAPANFVRSNSRPALESIISRHSNLRVYGDCFAQTAVAHGMIDAALLVNLKLWDAAALEVLMIEAGAKVQKVEQIAATAGAYLTYAVGKPQVVDYLVKFLQ